MGEERGDWPSDGGLVGKACTPGSAASFGWSDRAGSLLPGLEPQHGVALGHHREAGHRLVGGHLGDVLVDLLHALEVAGGVAHRGALWRHDTAVDDPAVLHRRQLALDGLEQGRAACAHDQAQHHHPSAMGQRERQRATVGARQRVQAALDEVVQPAVRLLVAQHERAHHGRERQRDEARHQHGARQGQRELDEQAARAARGEGQRRVDGDQRQRHGNDGEADLARAQQRGLHARLAFLDVAEDILEHDDGVVHH